MVYFTPVYGIDGISAYNDVAGAAVVFGVFYLVELWAEQAPDAGKGLLVAVGLLAGFLASLVAAAVGWALARYVFEFSWSASPWVPLVGGAAGALLALAAGWWGLREVLRRPVMQTLRQAADV